MALFGKFLQLLKFCNLTAAAVTPRRPAQPRPTALQVQHIPGRKSTNPANSRDPLSQPQRAHDHGNSFSGSEGQPHSAICEMRELGLRPICGVITVNKISTPKNITNFGSIVSSRCQVFNFLRIFNFSGLLHFVKQNIGIEYRAIRPLNQGFYVFSEIGHGCFLSQKT
jgi:hypothetical protein